MFLSSTLFSNQHPASPHAFLIGSNLLASIGAISVSENGDEDVVRDRVLRGSGPRDRARYAGARGPRGRDSAVRAHWGSSRSAARGTIDILVNNAGYFLEGAVEECSANESFQQFNTSVFGVLSVCRAVLPYMRAQKSGVVANVGSIAGWRGFPDSGLYCASKLAVAGLTESLRGDVAHLGIEVTVIEPGYFRTSFLHSGHAVVQTRIADLEPATAPIKALYGSKNGKQAGDPVKGAKLIVEALTKISRCEGHQLPVRLALGKDAVTFESAVLALRHQELDEWAELVSTTDFDDDA